MLIGQKIELFVADVEVSANFYHSVLGFSVGKMREVVLDGRLLRHTPVFLGPVMIGLGYLDGLSLNHHLRRSGLTMPKGIGVEICLYVEDHALEPLYHRALTHSKTRTEELTMQPWGVRDFRVIDPDGYYVRVSSPDKDWLPVRLCDGAMPTELLSPASK